MAQRYFNSTMFDGDNNQRANYARLLCLLVEQGTLCMKNYVLSHLPSDGTDPPDDGELRPLVENRRNLHDVLLDKKGVFQSLKEKKRIGNEVYNQLFPPSGIPVNEEKFDMTCWYVLCRNLAVNKPKVNYGQFERNPPRPQHKLPQHNVIRIRNMRNTLFHLDSTDLESETFEVMWTGLSTALCLLGTPIEDIEGYKTRDLNPMTTMTHYIRLREQVFQDLENVYNLEIKKKKHLVMSLVMLGILLLAVALASNCITYLYARTWSSCIHSMKTILTVNGVISIMPRHGWGAKPAKATNPVLKTPLPYVIISDTTVTGHCSTTDDCCNMCLVTQEVSFYQHLNDVAFNYLVGNDGVIYEGRGHQQSAAATGWNDKSITVGFLGKYLTSLPTEDATSVIQLYLQYLVDTDVLSPNFTLYGLCQVRPFPDAPGADLYRIIQTWHGIGQKNTWSWRHHENEKCNTNGSYLPGLS